MADPSLNQRLPQDSLDPVRPIRFRHWSFQHVAEVITDTGSGAGTDPHPQQLLQQGLDLADAQVVFGAQHPHKRAEPRATATGLHLRRQLATGAGTSAGADQAVLSDVRSPPG